MSAKDFLLLQGIGRELNQISMALHLIDLDEVFSLSDDEFKRFQSIQKAVMKLAFDVNIRLLDSI